MSIKVARPKDIVTPGVRVGNTDTHRAGFGVHEIDGSLFATLVGVLTLGPPSPGEARQTISVTHSRANENGVLMHLPEIAARVTARVVKITPRAAHTELIAVEGVPLRDVFKGTIRQQDVRQTEIDTVEIYKCFRPGDIVVAQVISLGDRHAYFLSTAKNELGVIIAKSAAGEPMVPISWEQMECPKTKTIEPRKVAKR